MSESDRVQRWREAKRQQGLKACTMWLTPEEELRLKDLAARQRCSPSTIVQQALAQFSQRPFQRISNDTDTSQLRQLIREEIAAMLPLQPSITDTVPVTDTEIPPRVTPAWHNGGTAHPQAEADTDEQGAPPAQDPTESLTADDRQAMSQEEMAHAREPVTVTKDSNVTDTEAPAAPVLEATPPGRRPERPSNRRQRIVDLLQAHPKGLTEEQLMAELRLRQTIGNVLTEMVRDHVLEQRGRGRNVRYVVA